MPPSPTQGVGNEARTDDIRRIYAGMADIHQSYRSTTDANDMDSGIILEVET